MVPLRATVGGVKDCCLESLVQGFRPCVCVTYTNRACVSDTFQTPVVVTACKHQWVVTACVVHSVGNNRKTIENNVRWYHDVVTTTGVTIHWCLGASAHVPNTSGGDRTQKIAPKHPTGEQQS